MSRPSLFATLIAGLATLSLLLALVACDGETRDNEPDTRLAATAVSPSTHTPTATATLAAPPPSIPTETAAAQAETPTAAAQAEYLTAEVEPCTPVDGSAVDPCEYQVILASGFPSGMASSPGLGNEPASIRSFLYYSLGHTTHIVLRGTYLPDTVRCVSGVLFHVPSYREPGYTQNLYHTECYADVRVNSYVVGSGPTKLTVMASWRPYFAYEVQQLADRRGTTTAEVENADVWLQEYILRTGAGHGPSGTGIGGREAILFIGPAHSAATEVWEVYSTWDVQRNADDEVVVIHPHAQLWRQHGADEYQAHIDSLEMSLSDFTDGATAAHQARVTEYGGRIGPADASGKVSGVDLPMLETDANMLTEYYEDIDAYEHPRGAPVSPAPVHVCSAGSAALENTTDARDLALMLRACEMLLDGKDTLRGTASLNWSKDTDIASWDGITIGEVTDAYGTSDGVKKVLLANESLNGSIPGEIGFLFGLTHLDLSNNSLTGEIPEELGQLQRLEELRLSGNSLTGCIPIGLERVPTNDLDDLDLPYCDAEEDKE